MNIQWYPGHMAKTRRLISDNLKNVDAVCEIVDARIPLSSQNPDVAQLCGDKPKMIVLNRIDLADSAVTDMWEQYFKNLGYVTLKCNSKSGAGCERFAPLLKQLLEERVRRNLEKGQTGRALRAMIAGIPNVGKSTFINRISKRAAAKAEDRPGVTRTKQWVVAGDNIELLDTPGILWHKFEDKTCALNLAFTGAVKDQIMDLEALASELAALLWNNYPEQMRTRYKLDIDPATIGYEMLEQLGRKRGTLLSGGVVDTERMSKILLDEFRSGTIGKISLERP